MAKGSAWKESDASLGGGRCAAGRDRKSGQIRLPKRGHDERMQLGRLALDVGRTASDLRDALARAVRRSAGGAIPQQSEIVRRRVAERAAAVPEHQTALQSGPGFRDLSSQPVDHLETRRVGPVLPRDQAPAELHEHVPHRPHRR